MAFLGRAALSSLFSEHVYISTYFNSFFLFVEFEHLPNGHYAKIPEVISHVVDEKVITLTLKM